MTHDSDTPMNGSDLLYLFLDGHASPAEKDMLFKAMASDSELQAEFEDALTIRNAIHNERETTVPPSELTSSLFAKAGIAIPVVGTSVISAAQQNGTAFSSMFGKVFSTILPYAAVGITALSAVLLWNSAEQYESTSAANGIASNKASSAVKRIDNSEELLQRIERLEREQREGFAAQNQLLRNQKNTVRNVYMPYVPKGFALVSDGDIEDMKQRIISSAIAATQVASMQQLQSKQPLSTDITSVQSSNPTESIASSVTTTSPSAVELLPSQESQERFSVNLRTINGIKQYPDRNITTPDIMFNNLAVTALYDFNNNHSFGFELGQETFPIYEVNESNDLEQKYSLIWGGASYRYRMNPISELLDIQPFGQVLAGGTKYGPIMRGIIGVTWQPHNNFSFSFGVETSAMLYSYRNVWYGAQKLGLSYGVNIHL